MKQLLLVGLGLLASGTAYAAAQRTPFQIRCEDTIAKTISVLSLKENGYTVNNQLSIRGLSAKAPSIDGRESLGLTITQAQSDVRIEAGQILQDQKSGYECIAPKVDIKLNYSPVLIYVANEFAPGSCGYRTVLEHELRHMRLYMENLMRVESVVREALNKRFEGKPFYAPSGTAMSALEHEMHGTWFPFIREEFDKVRSKQAEIDTPEEYARVGKECDGEIEAILQRRSKKN